MENKNTYLSPEVSTVELQTEGTILQDSQIIGGGSSSGGFIDGE